MPYSSPTNSTPPIRRLSPPADSLTRARRLLLAQLGLTIVCPTCHASIPLPTLAAHRAQPHAPG